MLAYTFDSDACPRCRTVIPSSPQVGNREGRVGHRLRSARPPLFVRRVARQARGGMGTPRRDGRAAHARRRPYTPGTDGEQKSAFARVRIVTRLNVPVAVSPTTRNATPR